jgi:hypothetical protein
VRIVGIKAREETALRSAREGNEGALPIPAEKLTEPHADLIESLNALHDGIRAQLQKPLRRLVATATAIYVGICGTDEIAVAEQFWREGPLRRHQAMMRDASLRQHKAPFDAFAQAA